MIKGKVHGTTLSGHPTRTTLGNTLRVSAYVEYICIKANIPKTALHVNVAGDDVLIFIEKEYL